MKKKIGILGLTAFAVTMFFNTTANSANIQEVISLPSEMPSLVKCTSNEGYYRECSGEGDGCIFLTCH